MPYAVINIAGLSDEQVKSLLNRIGYETHKQVRNCGGITLLWHPREGEYYYPRNGFPLNGGDIEWFKFGDEGESEDPMTFGSVKQALNWLKKAREFNLTENEIGTVDLILWMHPEAHLAEPLEYYVRMSEGAQFPGSPKQ